MKILICNDFPIFLKVSLFFFLELTVPTGFQHNKVGMSGGYDNKPVNLSKLLSVRFSTLTTWPMGKLCANDIFHVKSYFTMFY